jgi:outer membrane protein/protease secretion system outer membrane protein
VNLKKQKKLTSSSRLEAKSEEQNLLLRVAISYLNVLATADNVLLHKKKIELIKEQKRFAEKSILAGTGTKTDLLEISVSLDRAYATLIQFLQQQDFSLAELSVLVGEDIKNIHSFDHKRFVPEDFNPNSLIKWQENSIKNNPKIMSLGERLDATQIAIQSAKYDHFPSVDFTAQISRGSSESTFFVNSSTETQSIGLTFFMPIYQGGSLTSRVRQSMEQYNLESEELRKLKNEIKIKVQGSYNSVLEQKSLIKALIKAQESAQSLVIANERSVELGIRRRLDVLVSQQQLISVEKDLALTRFQLISGWLSLHFNSGLSLDREIEFINGFLKKTN